MIHTSTGVTDPGNRTANQDRIFFDDSLGLYVVCDGLGGRRAGDVAAELAVQAIRQFIESSRDGRAVSWPYGSDPGISLGANRLITAAKLANDQVWRQSGESLAFLGMGTTICAVLIEEATAVVVNIGDSRAYLYRDARLEQWSVDDTAVGTHQPTRELSLDDGTFPSMRSVLTRAAGSHENAEVHLKICAVQPGDRLLLCSDGLHGCVSPDQIAAILENTPGSATDLLLAAAKAAGAPDNISAIVVHFAA